jgi:hypothetical protein
VTNRFGRRYELPAGDLQRLMNSIVDVGGPEDARDVERLLGTLATLSPGEDETIAFVAPRGTAQLVERALQVMARSDRHLARARRTRKRT